MKQRPCKSLFLRVAERVSTCTRPALVRSGFTLIELLVVIAIIAILAAILLPSLQKARMRAQSINCLAQQKNISLAIIQYTGDNEEYFPPFLVGALSSGVTWNLALARGRYIPTAKLYFCPSANNMDIYSRPDSASSCGTITDFSQPSSYKWQYTTYAYNYMWFGSSRGRSFNLSGAKPTSASGSNSDLPPAKNGEVRNPGKKILIGDSNHATMPQRGYYVFGPYGFSDNGRPFARHVGTCNFGFADGHSENLSGDEFDRTYSGADVDRLPLWDPFSKK